MLKQILVACAALTLFSGCSNPMRDLGDGFGNALNQAFDPDTGQKLSTTKSMEVPKNGERFNIRVGGIFKDSISILRENRDDIFFEVELRGETDPTNADYQKELAAQAPTATGIDIRGAKNCRYTAANKSKHVNKISGSCIFSMVVRLPDVDLERAFINSVPLFNSPIVYEDAAAILSENAFYSENLNLAQLYFARRGPNKDLLARDIISDFLFYVSGDRESLIQLAKTAHGFLADPENVVDYQIPWGKDDPDHERYYRALKYGID